MQPPLATRSIRDTQKKAILKILDSVEQKEAFHTGKQIDLNDNSTKLPIWKVLILDNHTQKIVSPLVKVNELRSHDVTLFLDLDSTRHPISDVSAIYFLEPTINNIKQIAIDFERHMYGQYYFHFCSYLSRDLLEELAQYAVKTAQTDKVIQLTDQYMDFTCLESNLFTLNQHHTFSQINNPSTTSDSMSHLMNQISTSLISVLSALDTFPLIRYEKATSCDALAGLLEQKLKDHYGLVTKQGSKVFNTNDILILLDRSCDLVTPLKHKWTYGSLIYDILDIKLNRVSFQDPQDHSKKTYDIDMKDSFWQHNASLSFPQVAENVDQALKAYKLEMEKLGSLSNHHIPEVDTAKTLKSALHIMPAMTEKKRLIDLHMNISLALLHWIKTRYIDQFVTFEQSIPMSKQTKKSLVDLFHSNPSLNHEDKLRLYLMYYLSKSDISKADQTEIEHAVGLSNQNDLAILNFLKHFKSVSRITSISSPTKSTVNTESIMSKIMLGTQRSPTPKVQDMDGISAMFGGLISSGMKNLLSFSEEKDVPIIHAIDRLESMPNLVHGSSNYEQQFNSSEGISLQLVQKDPIKHTNSRKVTMMRDYRKIIVFILGGLTFDEYQQLNEFFKKQDITCTVIIGTTEMISSKELIEQFEVLGSMNK